MENVGYLRVSSEAQTEKYGLDLQRDAILKKCAGCGVEIEKWYIDGGYSGSSLNRPEFENLMEDATKGLIKTVWVYKLDRMSRDTIDTLTLLYKELPKLNINIKSVSEEIRLETPMDKVMVTMNSAMNQYEREVILMRMRAGRMERAKSGKLPCGSQVPYGYRYDRNDELFHIIPEQAEIVKKIFSMYLDGFSQAEIAEKIRFVTTTQVRRILQRKTYCGYMPYKGEWYKAEHESIISEDIYNATQREMAIRRGKLNRCKNNKHNHLLTGILYCKNCGGKICYKSHEKSVEGEKVKLNCYNSIPSWYKTKKYTSRINGLCNVHGLESAYVEEQVISAFKLFTITPETSDADETREITSITIKIDELGRKLKRLYDLYAKSDTDTLLDVIRETEDKKRNEVRKLELLKSKSDHKSKLGRIKMGEVFDDLSFDEKRKCLMRCIDKIIVDENGNAEIYFVTE